MKGVNRAERSSVESRQYLKSDLCERDANTAAQLMDLRRKGAWLDLHAANVPPHFIGCPAEWFLRSREEEMGSRNGGSHRSAASGGSTSRTSAPVLPLCYAAHTEAAA